MTLSTILVTCLLGYALAGCGAGPPPRMLDLVGEDAFSEPSGNDEWWQVSHIGLVVHSDVTAQNAAPAITAEYLETLSHRTEEFLKQRCSFHEILTFSPLSQPVNFSQELKVQSQWFQAPYIIVVVFSSREQAGPAKFGEATMMTQMGGTIIENSAMAEAGVLRVSDFKMVFWTLGRWHESLEQLSVPIGKNRLSAIEARDLLRARAGQEALDRALEHVGAACQPVA